MREQIVVVYENGVLRPVGQLPARLREHQHLTVTLEDSDTSDRWLADANPADEPMTSGGRWQRCRAPSLRRFRPNARNAELGTAWPTASSTPAPSPSITGSRSAPQSRCPPRRGRFASSHLGPRCCRVAIGARPPCPDWPDHGRRFPPGARAFSCRYRRRALAGGPRRG